MHSFGVNNITLMFQRTKVFVGSLPPGSKPEDLRRLFEKFGIVTECDIMNRCGFVHMQTQEMADNAIKSLNNSLFNGANIVVERGRMKERKGPNPGGPGSIGSGGGGGPNKPSSNNGNDMQHMNSPNRGPPNRNNNNNGGGPNQGNRGPPNRNGPGGGGNNGGGFRGNSKLHSL